MSEEIKEPVKTVVTDPNPAVIDYKQIKDTQGFKAMQDRMRQEDDKITPEKLMEIMQAEGADNE